MSKAYNDKVLIDNLTFRLPAGGIVGVIGPNGAGKTTLFRMITGQDKPDSGTLRVGETVELGMSINLVTRSTTTTRSIKRFPADMIGWKWVVSESTREPTFPSSTLKERTRKRRSAFCPVENATAFIWPNFCDVGATFCYWTNRQ